MKLKRYIPACRIPAFLLALGITAFAQSPSLITQPIDNNRMVILAGNTRPETTAANDQGAVPDSTPIDHMLLQLQRAPQVEQAAVAFIDQLHDPNSTNYHHWLTAAQFGQQYGLSQQDLSKISGWLTAQGFTVNTIYPSGMIIDFSGTAGQISSAFHTQIHNLLVNGEAHIANMSNPQIPVALAPAVSNHRLTAQLPSAPHV